AAPRAHQVLDSSTASRLQWPASHMTFLVLLGYPEIPDSSPGVKFALSVDIDAMPADRLHCDLVQLSQRPFNQPNRLPIRPNLVCSRLDSLTSPTFDIAQFATHSNRINSGSPNSDAIDSPSAGP